MGPLDPQYEHRIMDSKIAARVASKRESERYDPLSYDWPNDLTSYELYPDSFGNFDPSDALLNHKDDQR